MNDLTRLYHECSRLRRRLEWTVFIALWVVGAAFVAGAMFVDLFRGHEPLRNEQLEIRVGGSARYYCTCGAPAVLP